MPDQNQTETTTNIMEDVSEKIRSVHNILVALSSDPSVDEIAAAIGLSLCLDRAGKRATAIYSGKTPNALEFLKPENTFETNSDVLRDFVIALSKDKADHLRYKLDGDFVKIFITPYKSRIDEDDLEFSYGDFNIELVLALDVTSGIDLDDALREHGRVMHDAVVVNITNGNPGKFGDIEWSDKSKSSISEMVADLLYNIGGNKALEGEEATALLTGIVAATEHFSNNHTNAAALQTAARLIESGANRELISENIGMDSQNMFLSSSSSDKGFGEKAEDPSLDIAHGEDSEPEKTTDKSTVKDEAEPAAKTESTESPKEEPAKEEPAKDDALLADLQAAADSLSHAGAETTPEAINEPLRIDKNGNEIVSETAAEPTTVEPITEPTAESTPTPTSTFLTEPEPSSISTAPALSSSENPIEPSEALGVSEPTNFEATVKEEKTITPTEDFANETFAAKSNNKYGQMLEEALAEANAAESVTAEPLVSPAETIPAPEPNITTPTVEPIENPAMTMAPPVATEPEINGVPEMNYMPMPGDEILPPPPAPPIDLNSPLPTPDMAPTVPVAPAIPEPSAPAPQTVPASPEPTIPTPTEPASPGSFQIPTPTA